jgi:ankyrin repeat protein
MPELLENAIMQNDHAYVQQGLNQFDPVPANSVNEALQTGLMIACQHKSIETVKVFLKMSTTVKNDDPSYCNVNLVDTSGWTALHYAAQSGTCECVKLLFENKANTNSVNAALKTGLMIACKHKSLETVKVFLKKSTTVKNDDPSYCNVNLMNASSWAALHHATQSGSFECVKLLIEHKAEIDATTDKNETALFLATKQNHPDIVEFLAEKNCQLQTEALYNKYLKEEKITALEFAGLYNFVEIAKCLLFHLIRTKKLNKEQLKKLLVEAVKEGHTKIAHELIINGADVNYSPGKLSLRFYLKLF